MNSSPSSLPSGPAPRLIVLTVVLALLSGGRAFAEATDVVMEGKVVDQTGAVIAAVKVSLIGAASHQATSDKEGRFASTAPEGSYVLTAEKTGFVPFAASNLEMKAGPVMTRDIQLEVARSEDVTVEEQAATLSLALRERGRDRAQGAGYRGPARRSR